MDQAEATHGRSNDPTPPRTHIDRAVHLLNRLLVSAGMLLCEVRRLEVAEASGELSQVIRRAGFPYEGRKICQNEVDRLRGETHSDAAIKAIRLHRSMRDAANVLLCEVGNISPWVDDNTKPAHERFTSQLGTDVRELKGCLYLGQSYDFTLSDLPWPDQGIGAAMTDVMGRLERRLLDLKSIERTPAAPISLPAGSLDTYRGELDPEDAAVLLQLSDQDVWGLDELSPTVTEDVLRCLDRHGLIEVRTVHMKDMRPYPGAPSDMRPVRNGWFSPLANAGHAGGWDAVIKHKARGHSEHPWEIRLTEEVKDEARTIRRSMTKAASADQESKRRLIRLPSPETGTEDGVLPMPDPSAFPTDLEHLDGWAQRLEAWCKGGEPANRHLWIIFKPDEMTANAMMRLSIKFPLVMRQVHDTLDFVEKYFEPMKAGDPAAEDAFNGGLFSLMERILAAVATIRAAEDDRGTDKAERDQKRRWTQDEVIKAAKKYLERKVFPGVRPLADALGCPLGTLAAALDADPELDDARNEYMKSRKRKSPSVRAGNAGDAIETLGAETPVPESMEDMAQGILHRLLDEYEPKRDREAAEEVVKLKGGEMRTLLISAMNAEDQDAYAAASDAVHDLIRQGVHERSRPRTPLESP